MWGSASDMDDSSAVSVKLCADKLYRSDKIMDSGCLKMLSFCGRCHFLLFKSVVPRYSMFLAPAFVPRKPSWFGNGTGHGSDLIGSTSDIVNPAYRNFMAGY